MLRFLTLLVAAFIFLIFETTLEPYIFHLWFSGSAWEFLVHIRVNIFVIIVMVLAVHREPLEGAIQSAMVGYLMDMFYLGMFGINTFIAISLYIIIKLILGVIQSEKISHVILYSGLFSLMEGGIRLLLFLTFSRPIDGYVVLMLINMVLTMAMAPIIFKFFVWVDSLIESSVPGVHDFGLSKR